MIRTVLIACVALSACVDASRPVQKRGDLSMPSRAANAEADRLIAASEHNRAVMREASALIEWRVAGDCAERPGAPRSAALVDAFCEIGESLE